MKKLYLLFMIITGCSSTSNNFPDDINIVPNQLIYKDNRMQMWANDAKGIHHNYSPNDSSEYAEVTNHISSNLHTTFLGYCNYHSISEIVNIGPKIVRVLSHAENNIYNRLDNARREFENNNDYPNRVQSGVSVMTPGPQRSFQPVQQTTDTKN